MKMLVMIGVAGCALTSLAMPTRSELAKAQAMVSDVTSADVKALKAGTKKPAEVAATHMELAAKANTEAEKYLLLQGAFRLYVKDGDYEQAAKAIETMQAEIEGLNPEVIIELCGKEFIRKMKENAPRLYALKENARRIVFYRKQLPVRAKAAKEKPTDVLAQKKLGECHAELGDWPKALSAFANAGGKLAKTASAEAAGTAKAQDLADFWWDYETKSDTPIYRLHAAELYRQALSDNTFQGLARERADRRMKEVEADGTATLCAVAKPSPSAESSGLVVPNVRYKGGETIKLMLDQKQNMELEFAAIPPGEFVIGMDDSKNDEKHTVRLTYPYLIMKGAVTYAEADVIALETAKKGHAKFSAGTEKVIPDSPVMELSWSDIQLLVRKLNEKVKVPSELRQFAGYEFRLPTNAEWMHASRADSEPKGWDAWTDEWSYWWGKLKKGSYCPFAPVSSRKNAANPWGLYYLGPKTICADTYADVVSEGEKDLCYVKESIFHYEKFETNPVRLWQGNDFTYMAYYKGGVRRLFPKGHANNQRSPFRFVFAPKLSLLNVYPRTEKSEPPKAVGRTPAAGSAAAAKPLSFELAKGLNLELAHCPAGTFKMSNAPGGPNGEGTHEVKLTRAYWIASTRVTREMYKAFEADYDKDEQTKDGKKPDDLVGGRARAEAFAGWLNKRFGSKLPQGYVFRLPSEAEWEYAYQRGIVTKRYEFEGTLDTAKAVSKKQFAWKFDLSVMDYSPQETDPVRICTQEPAWVCRQSTTKRFLLRPDAKEGVFRMAIGPDLLAEKKK